MQIEIELKAWVHELPALRTALVAHGARKVRDYRKEDRYFRSGTQDVRIRMDDAETIVTFKDKRVVDGLEISDEHEFTVSDAATMTELLVRLGARSLVDKIKIGEAWELDGLLLEISEVVGLGHFIELERVVELADSDQASRERLTQETGRLIRKTLGKLGIPETAIEPKSYTGMLLARK